MTLLEFLIKVNSLYLKNNIILEVLNHLIHRQDPEAIERYYREKYANADSGRFGEGEQMSDEIRQQSKLPGVKYACLCACFLSIVSQPC